MDREDRDRQRADDTPPMPGTAAPEGETEQGDNQDVAAEKIYPTDPTGAEPA